ncbi:TonB-dependent copper receptor [Neisseria sp. N95_16]|uniref:TonB-dependent copper receptor n=1 Tax=Neisseria brasiliensis TaxID=2666100 RepID=A0A5Q3S0R6_9NEIS|nr:MULTISPECIES: TonB-dependent copper receptor [Neisseria]MRN38626.1 TonB-dependent copper receptor [Neisseria brasiliensis]PJO10734.1 TonB-dependent copper receptor [Neisseria sp. N95_16]PJO78693.1 TonB-dependent copper receptor [Neisseria sp. N177_16]QGL25535.1 TonB-dependent copper receptor [Neisseria brasiliensis]
MKPSPFLSLLPLSFSISTTWGSTELPPLHQELEPVVVTAAPQNRANIVQFNTKRAVQPLPANDGAGLLLSVPNMNVIRKGGTSGDPLFRGLGGSRLAIQADDQFIYGGCGGRMDPPTAYIFPNSYDQVVITKGPQTVTQGTGLVAGSARFVRKEPKFHEKNIHFNTAYTIGSFGRHDAMVDGTVGNELGYARLNATYNTSDDYQDGDNNKAHSNFERNSQMLQLGLTPSPDTLLAATYERSRAKAAYSDRMMDGSKFDRDAWNVRGVQHNINDWFAEAEFRYGQSTIDHVMDNYSMRPVRPGMARANNPKRETDTAQLKTTFDFNNIELQTGIDYMRDKHSSRSGTDYASKPYTPNQNFTHWGGFAEANWAYTDHQNWIAGYRHDEIKAIYDAYPLNDTARTQKYNLNSGFLRYEHQAGNTKYYLGLGTAERAPDYWERNRSEDLLPERNNQIDTGVIWQNDKWRASVSLFGSRINNFILVDNSVGARNIRAERFGGEAEFNYRFAPNWTIGSSLAYTYGKNRTDNIPLAQTPPLDWKTSLNWDNGKFNAGALWRVVNKQKRFAKGQGNIIGQDIGASAGFGVLSLNAGWKINKNAILQAGVDNVFNKTYAEFVNKAGNASAGVQTTRVNEPGRQFWLRGQMQF